MIDDRILQLQGEARKAGKALIIISEGALVMEGKGGKLAEIIGTAFIHLMVGNNKIAAKQFVVGCSAAIYGAAMAGCLSDAEITQLSEALAVARAHKQGRKN